MDCINFDNKFRLSLLLNAGFEFVTDIWRLLQILIAGLGANDP